MTGVRLSFACARPLAPVLYAGLNPGGDLCGTPGVGVGVAGSRESPGDRGIPLVRQAPVGAQRNPGLARTGRQGLRVHPPALLQCDVAHGFLQRSERLQIFGRAAGYEAVFDTAIAIS